MSQFLHSQLLGCPVWVLLWVVSDLAFTAWAFRQWWLKKQLSVEGVVAVELWYVDGKRERKLLSKACWEEFFVAFRGGVQQLLEMREDDGTILPTPFNCAKRYGIGAIQVKKMDNELVNWWRFHGQLRPEDFLYLGNTVWTRRGEMVKSLLWDLSPDRRYPLFPRELATLLNNPFVTGEMVERFVAYESLAFLSLGDPRPQIDNLFRCVQEANSSPCGGLFRLSYFNGNLPGTSERIMELVKTDKGTEQVLACIRRGGKAEEAPQPRSAGVRS